MIVTITAIIFLFNIIHLSFLFQLKQQKGTVFYITLRVDAVVNTLISATVNFGTQFGIRKYKILRVFSVFVTYLIPYCYSYADIRYDGGYGVIGMGSP